MSDGQSPAPKRSKAEGGLSASLSGGASSPAPAREGVDVSPQGGQKAKGKQRYTGSIFDRMLDTTDESSDDKCFGDCGGADHPPLENSSTRMSRRTFSVFREALALVPPLPPLPHQQEMSSSGDFFPRRTRLRGCKAAARLVHPRANAKAMGRAARSCPQMKSSETSLPLFLVRILLSLSFQLLWRRSCSRCVRVRRGAFASGCSPRPGKELLHVPVRLPSQCGTRPIRRRLRRAVANRHT